MNIIRKYIAVVVFFLLLAVGSISLASSSVGPVLYVDGTCHCDTIANQIQKVEIDIKTLRKSGKPVSLDFYKQYVGFFRTYISSVNKCVNHHSQRPIIRSRQQGQCALIKKRCEAVEKALNDPKSVKSIDEYVQRNLMELPDSIYRDGQVTSAASAPRSAAQYKARSATVVPQAAAAVSATAVGPAYRQIMKEAEGAKASAEAQEARALARQQKEEEQREALEAERARLKAEQEAAVQAAQAERERQRLDRLGQKVTAEVEEYEALKEKARKEIAERKARISALQSTFLWKCIAQEQNNINEKSRVLEILRKNVAQARALELRKNVIKELQEVASERQAKRHYKRVIDEVSVEARRRAAVKEDRIQKALAPLERQLESLAAYAGSPYTLFVKRG